MTEVSLDDPPTYRSLDREDMYRRVKELPQQMEDAWERAGALELPDAFRGVRSVVVAGMGGSAIGGSLLESYGAQDLPVPFSVWRYYGIPAYAGENTLLIAVSYSGNTEETLSALRAGRESGCKLMAISTDGQIAGLAESWGIPLMTFQYAAQPRATLGYLFTPLVRICERLGFLPPQEDAYAEALQIAREAEDLWGGSVMQADNPAKQMASLSVGRGIVVYSASYLSAVARRWKTQINENSKTWAFWEEFPELNHNAIVGYEYPCDFMNQTQVFMLSGTHLHDRVQIRMDVTRRLMEQYGVPYQVVEARGEGKLAQMFSLIALGDYVSYYLALLNGADPTTIGPIDYLKAELGHAPDSSELESESAVRPGLTTPQVPSG